MDSSLFQPLHSDQDGHDYFEMHTLEGGLFQNKHHEASSDEENSDNGAFVDLAPQTDDVTSPSLTFRAFLLGSLCTSCCNTRVCWSGHNQ